MSPRITQIARIKKNKISQTEYYLISTLSFSQPITIKFADNWNWNLPMKEKLKLFYKKYLSHFPDFWQYILLVVLSILAAIFYL